MATILDFYPFKIGDRVYNQEEKELEIWTISVDDGIQCSDMKWYNSFDLHYKHDLDFDEKYK